MRATEKRPLGPRTKEAESNCRVGRACVGVRRAPEQSVHTSCERGVGRTDVEKAVLVRKRRIGCEPCAVEREQAFL